MDHEWEQGHYSHHVGQSAASVQPDEVQYYGH